MPSKARTAPRRRPPAVGALAVSGDGEQPATGQLTPHDVADLINRGKLTVADGDALMAELGQRRLKHDGPATFAVPVAVPVPADTRPAAAMAHLDNAVQNAVARMTWTTLHDTGGYVIDAPQRPDSRPSRASRPLSAGGDVALVTAAATGPNTGPNDPTDCPIDLRGWQPSPIDTQRRAGRQDMRTGGRTPERAPEPPGT